jgi:hypothetical protein
METESKNDGILENAKFPGVRLEQASLQLHITSHLKLASWEEESMESERHFAAVWSAAS